MKKKGRQNPYGYNGTGSTSHPLHDLLPVVMGNIGSRFSDRPDLIMDSWKEIIGPKFAPMTQAVSFVDGVLTVRVTNSTLLSLLKLHEKSRLLKALRERFPKSKINNIAFRM